MQSGSCAASAARQIHPKRAALGVSIPPGEHRRPPLRQPTLELLVDPGHLVAHLLADALDRVALALVAHAREVLAAGAVLGDPLAGELARLNLVEDLLHRGAGGLADDAL